MTSKMALNFLAFFLVFFMAGIAIAETDFLYSFYNSVKIGFYPLDSSFEKLPYNMPVALVNSNGSVTREIQRRVTCPSWNEIGGHKDIRVQNLGLYKQNAPNSENGARLTKNLRNVVGWYMYGGCGDDNLIIRASPGREYNANASFKIFAQNTQGKMHDDGCRDIEQSELPVDILSKIKKSIDYNDKKNNWVTLSIFSKGEARYSDTYMLSCIYTTCDYDGDGLSSKDCGGIDVDDYTFNNYPPQIEPEWEIGAIETYPAFIMRVNEGESEMIHIKFTSNRPNITSEMLLVSDSVNISLGKINANSSQDLQENLRYHIPPTLQTGSYDVYVILYDNRGNTRTFLLGMLYIVGKSSQNDTNPNPGGLVINRIVTNPPFPIFNNGSSQILKVNIDANRYPLYSRLEVYNRTEDRVFASVYLESLSFNHSNDYIIPSLINGVYNIDMRIRDVNDNEITIELGNMSVQSTPPANYTNQTNQTDGKNSGGSTTIIYDDEEGAKKVKKSKLDKIALDQKAFEYLQGLNNNTANLIVNDEEDEPLKLNDKALTSKRAIDYSFLLVLLIVGCALLLIFIIFSLYYKVQNKR